MGGAITFKVHGFKGVEAGLMELKTATAKSVARRVLKKAAQPIAEVANATAPVDDGDLSGSYTVGTRLTKRQFGLAKREGRDDVFMYIGTANPAGMWQEFGTYKDPAQPHFRPAWESGKAVVLNSIIGGMSTEVQKSVMRAARKDARAG